MYFHGKTAIGTVELSMTYICGNIALSKRKLRVLVLVQSHEWLWFTDLAMESSESPLDVLSRAATMVQDNVMPPSYGKFLLLFL